MMEVSHHRFSFLKDVALGFSALGGYYTTVRNYGESGVELGLVATDDLTVELPVELSGRFLRE